MEQVVINLITNSCQSLEDKEKAVDITTSYDKKSETVKIEVIDEGAGIPPENLKHIFDPFFTTKRDIEGTGLGLSISYNIIKDHEGELKLTSQQGKKTTAVINVPVKTQSI